MKIRYFGVALVAVFIMIIGSVSGMSFSFSGYSNEFPDAIAAATPSGGGSGGGGSSTPVKPKPVPVPIPVPKPAPAPIPVPVIPATPVEAQPDLYLYTMILDTQELPIGGLPVYLNTPKGSLVSLRSLCQDLGFQVTWNSADRTIRRSTIAMVSPGKVQASRDGQGVILSAAPEIRGGSTYVTLSFVKEILGYEASISNNRLVLLTVRNYVNNGEIIQQQSYQGGLIIRVYGSLESGEDDIVFITADTGTAITDEAGKSLGLSDLGVGKTVKVIYQGIGIKNDSFVGKALSIVVRPESSFSSSGSGGSSTDEDGEGYEEEEDGEYEDS